MDTPTWLGLFAALRPLDALARHHPWTPAQAQEVLARIARVRAVAAPLLVSLDPFPDIHAAWFESLRLRLDALQRQADASPPPPPAAP